MEFCNIGPVYMRVRKRGAGVGWVVAKAKTKKQDDTIVELRVAVMSICTHKRSVFHYKA